MSYTISDGTTTVTLDSPGSINPANEEDVELITFDEGGGDSDTIGTSTKTLMLVGEIHPTIGGSQFPMTFPLTLKTRTTELEDLDDFIDAGSEFTIAGLPDSNLDGQYYAEKFSVSMKEGRVEQYFYTLVLVPTRI